MATCVVILYKNTKPINTVLDPGLILVIVLLITAGATQIIFNVFFDEFCVNVWVLCSDPYYVPRIMSMNVMYSAIFTFIYVMTCRNFLKSTPIDSNTLVREYKLAYNPFFWLLVVILVRVVDKLFGALGMKYIEVYWGNIADLSYLVLYSALLLHIKGVRNTIVVVVLFSLFSMFIYYPIIVSDVYEVNKGGVIKDLVFCLVFLSLVKYPGKLITPFRFFLGIVFLPIFLGAANFAEALLGGFPVTLLDLAIYVIQGYEIQMLENQAYILNGIENGEFGMLNGASYLDALIDIFYPSSGAVPPSEWYADVVTFGTDVESGFGFSFLAEGILNFGGWGVFPTAIFSAAILLMIRSILNWKISLMPVLYSYFVTLSYYVYRSDMMYVLKKIEFTFMSIIVLLVLYTVVKYVVYGVVRGASNDIDFVGSNH
ncbi:MAG: hypothetical protein COB04_01280 [Gammaproteobacteria bacterium]|nr:MAG: hypothetical protein COB04_01280 [Gammaproteobacteria bacterium]